MTLKIHKNKWNWLGEKSRYFIITGGRGSGKSFEIGRFLTILSKKPKQKILFTRKTLTSAHASIIPEFTEKIELLNLTSEYDINKTEITHKYSGSEILFKGLQSSSNDNTANLKSLQGINVWVLDEAEELTDETTFDKIDLSIREKTRENKVIIILNPTTKEHFIYKRFFEQAEVQEGFTGTKGDTTYIHSTYLDNYENLSDSFLTRAGEMQINNPIKYNHIMLGGWLDKAEGVVFTNWKYGAFNPDNLQTSFGQDYGYSIDPTTLVEVAIDRKQKIIYCKEHLYKTKLTTSEIAYINNSICGNKLIVGDSAEVRLIDELVKLGCRIVGATKGAGSIEAGVSIMQDYELIVEGENIGKELNNYVYTDKGSKLYLDAFNHCFVGETLITTNNGKKRIDKIKINDLVLTSNGFKPVLKVFNNGIKKTIEYLIHCDTFSLSLHCTNNHKIKTTKGWKEIKNLTENDILYIQKKDTFREDVKECTKLYGNFTMAKYLKDTKCTIKTKIHTTTIYQTLKLLKDTSISLITVKKGLKIILNLQKLFKKQELQKPLNGINQKKELNGTNNTEKNVGKTEMFMKQKNVKNVGTNIKQGTKVFQDFAIITARLNQIEEIGFQENNVYDLMVQDTHEYFANGILVHNCLDAIRYNVTYNISGGYTIEIR